MSWKWATGLVLACMVILAFMAVETARADVVKPVPPGYRCVPVWKHCFKPGTNPTLPAVPQPTRTRVPRG